MQTDCSVFREQIPRALLEDLSAEERQVLERHLADCALCAEEQLLYGRTLRQLHAPADVPVPKHFFVSTASSESSPWNSFLSLPFRWKAAFSGALLTLLAAFGLTILNLTMLSRAANSTPSGTAAGVKDPVPVDTVQLKNEILRELEERADADRIETLRLVRAEIQRSGVSLSDIQRATLDRAISDLEYRLTERIVTNTQTMEDSTGKSLAALYQEVMSQRERDVGALSERLNRVAASGEIKNNQTDAILETLLQVADFKMK